MSAGQKVTPSVAGYANAMADAAQLNSAQKDAAADQACAAWNAAGRTPDTEVAYQHAQHDADLAAEHASAAAWNAWATNYAPAAVERIWEAQAEEPGVGLEAG